MLTDFHSHFLSEIDDGAENPKISARMCELFFAQGIRRILATPHFCKHTQTIPEFLRKRRRAFQALNTELNNLPQTRQNTACIRQRLKIQLAAEVDFSSGISVLDNIEALTISDSKFILIKLPISAFEEWIFPELSALTHRCGLTPIFSSFERYNIIYPPEITQKLLALQNAIFQINIGSLIDRRTQKLLKTLIAKNKRVLLGSNSHNMHSRAPDWHSAREILLDILDSSTYNLLLLQNNAFLNPKHL